VAVILYLVYKNKGQGVDGEFLS